MSAVNQDSEENVWSSLPMPQVCPICGAEASFAFVCPAVLATPEPVYALAECPRCRVRFLHPSPDEAALRRFRASQDFGADWYRQEEEGQAFARETLRVGFGERILDVGCNLGYFLHAVAHTSGWEAYGVEASPEAAAYAKEKLLLDVRCGELADAEYPDQFFDFVRAGNVLANVRQPAALLRECRRVLRKGGQLLLSVPNGPVDSARLARYFQSERTPPRSKDGRLFFFPESALQGLFYKAKLKVVSSRTRGIREGLRALGRYPRQLGWKNPYRLPDGGPEQTEQTEQAEPKEIVLAPRPRQLPGCAVFHRWRARLDQLPGMAGCGLDYEILLTAV